MKAKSVSVTEAVRHFSDYIGRVTYRHERFILLKGKRPVAELRPTVGGMALRELPDLLASLPRLAEDDAEAFIEDISKAREDLPAEGPRDPWES